MVENTHMPTSFYVQLLEAQKSTNISQNGCYDKCKKDAER